MGTAWRTPKWLIAPDKILDPTKYFIIIPNQFGNGLSSSPSNTPPPYDRGRYPQLTMTDQVRIQQRLLREIFGIAKVALVYGFSMGAQQAFHWGALFPDIVERIAPVCGSAKTTPHNFRLSRRREGGADRRQAWQDGWFATPACAGKRAMAGSTPAGVSPRPFTARNSGASSATPRSRIF